MNGVFVRSCTSPGTRGSGRQRLEAYLSRPDEVVKHTVIRALVASYETIDAPMIQYKVTWTGRALGALLTEALLSAILVIVGGVLVSAG